MSRYSRKRSLSKIYHIMIRGIKKDNIFLDDYDKSRFMEMLSFKKAQLKFSLYAYCLMNTHVHIIINEEESNISQIMRCINVSYAKYFNKKYTRVGYLFQDRFKSKSINTQSYLMQAIRYIHHNPVKAAMTNNLSNYKWSSFNEYFQNDEKGLIDKKFILDYLSLKNNIAKDKFMAYSLQPVEGEFIEYENIEQTEKIITTKKSAENFVADFVNSSALVHDNGGKLPDKLRNELIKQLRSISSLSLKEISEILGVSKSTVNKYK